LPLHCVPFGKNPICCGEEEYRYVQEEEDYDKDDIDANRTDKVQKRQNSDEEKKEGYSRQ
jgi:hypothetical protein